MNIPHYGPRCGCILYLDHSFSLNTKIRSSPACSRKKRGSASSTASAICACVLFPFAACFPTHHMVGLRTLKIAA